jgi:hypothetical protein
MKKVFFLLALIALTACKQPAQQNAGSSSTASGSTVKPIDTLQSIIDANINKQPVIDTAFLGFAFSMTQKQAMEHYIQLVKDKRLVKDADGKLLECPLNFSMVQAKATIGPEFYHDKMYRLTLMITPADESATPETVFLQAATAYMKKYDGSGFTLYRDQDPTDSTAKRFHWIKNNLHIYLHKGDGVTFVSYTDMPAGKAANKDKQNTADSSKAQTNKDI